MRSHWSLEIEIGEEFMWNSGLFEIGVRVSATMSYNNFVMRLDRIDGPGGGGDDGWSALWDEDGPQSTT